MGLYTTAIAGFDLLHRYEGLSSLSAAYQICERPNQRKSQSNLIRFTCLSFWLASLAKAYRPGGASGVAARPVKLAMMDAGAIHPAQDYPRLASGTAG